MKHLIENSDMLSAYERSGENLILEFKDGQRYIYLDVAESVVSEFINAASKGKFFSTRIKNKFTTGRLEDPVPNHPFPLYTRP